MRVVLLGAPGSGKGTQGVVVAERLGLAYLSTGELLRSEAAAGSPLGRQVIPYLDRGELVPDDLVVAAVAGALGSIDGAQGYVLDGFPRTVSQAEQAQSLVEPDFVVYLAVPDEVARQRLAERAPGGRTDDADPKVIEHRLRTFHAETEPLLGYYRARGVLAVVDAARPPGEVATAILAILTRPAH